MAVVLALTALCSLIFAANAPGVFADGDPGSDVLVNQDIFVPADANISIPQQVDLGNLLRAAQKSGFAIRVAIIAKPDDLGAVTELWDDPAAYAKFLGTELSLAYKQRLLVVMPNGLGFNWPGHPTQEADQVLSKVSVGAGGNGLTLATETAIRQLAAAAGVHLAASPSAGASPGVHSGASAAGNGASRGSAPVSPHGADPLALLAVVVVLAAIALAVWLAMGGRLTVDLRGTLRRLRARAGTLAPWLRPGRKGFTAASVLAVVVACGALFAIGLHVRSGQAAAQAIEDNPALHGTAISRPAPDFTLSDQFGRSVSLRDFRGKVVVLAFIDSECTSMCPLTTSAMMDAKSMLGGASSHVQLLGVDADPKATSIADVLSYSNVHRMTDHWDFLTGSLSQLQRVWSEYGVYAAVQHGIVSHAPALYVIGPDGRQRMLFLTQQSYAAVGQFGQLLAQEASTLLPGHPPVDAHLSYSHVTSIGPKTTVTLERAGGGTARLGPGSSRLVLFFATWNREITGLAGQLGALDDYEASARQQGLPGLTAVDEASTEPSPDALTTYLHHLPRALTYPVAVDEDGRVGDGYMRDENSSQSMPWFVLTSASGRVLWRYDVDTTGWPSQASLVQDVRSALASSHRDATITPGHP